MAYTCGDCSFKGKKSGANGECPACGSFNYRASTNKTSAEKTGNSVWRLVLVVGLWVYLIGHIAWKLTS